MSTPVTGADQSSTPDQDMSTQSATIPSGRPPNDTLAGRTVIGTSVVLGLMVLLGIDIFVVALIALGVLGSTLIATNRSIRHEPIAMLV
jgi:hypothetical protein